MYKYLKYKHKYLQLIKYGGASSSCSKPTDDSLEKLRQFVKYDSSVQQLIREPYNNIGYSKYIILIFLNNKDKFLEIERLIAANYSDLTACSDFGSTPELIQKCQNLFNSVDILDYINFISIIIAYEYIYQFDPHIIILLNILLNNCSTTDEDNEELFKTLLIYRIKLFNKLKLVQLPNPVQLK